MNLNGYKIIETIGRGTFGTVYKCFDKNHGVRCMKRIKLIKTSDVTANVHFKLIQQEIYLLQHLIHPRIIRLFDYYYSNDGNYIHIIMEYATRGSLAKFIANKINDNQFLNEREIKLLFIDILMGIEFLHMKNVVHKDLKPDNILIGDNGRLKIADFGESHVTNIDHCDLNAMFNNNNNQNGNNKANETGGTPLYMAPETLMYKHFSFSSDIWSLGCILYELCILKPAFDFVESMDQLIQCTLRKSYMPINSIIQLYSQELVSLCESMLIANISKRATIKQIIANRFIVVEYYRRYFDFS